MVTTHIDHNLNLDQEVARYRRRAVLAIQGAFMVGAAALFFQIAANDAVNYSILASALLSGLSIALALKNKVSPAAFILAGQFLILPTYLALSALGTFDSAILILPAGMMAISVVAKPRQTALFSLVALICVGVVALATYRHWIGNDLMAPLVDLNPVDIITVMVVIAFCGVVATYVSVILTGLLRTLANHQATLEDNIARRTSELAQSNEDLRATMKNLDNARVELVRGEKLAGLGSLVAGVAHELNTPIGNTAMAASTLDHHLGTFRQQFEGGNLRKSDLQNFVQACTDGMELILRSTHRARDLVASFKQVAVDQTSDRRRDFELNDVVNDIVRSMRPSFSGHAWTIATDIQPDIHCNSYPGPLGQIITNLIQNAVLHGFSDRSEGHIQIVGKKTENEQMYISITDDGHGIRPESLTKIFDPFFTTRLGQGGSGLGLTIVHNLATVLLGGRISVESTVGKGTSFILILPVIAPALAQGKPAA